MAQETPNFIFSYPGAFALFAEHCAGILKRYVGGKRVFTYTDGVLTQDLEAFFDEMARTMTEADKTYMIVLCQDKRIVQAQRLELDAWKVHRANQVALSLDEIFVDIKVNHLNHPIQADAEIPRSLLRDSTVWEGGNVYPEVSDLDKSSAERLAEYLLRLAFRFPRQQPSAKAFTYEKDVIVFYSDLLSLTKDQAYLDLPAEHRKRFDKEFKAGVPMAWPNVRVRTDVRKRENLKLKYIGSDRPDLGSLEKPGVAAVPNPAYVRVSALADEESAALRFLEAGPRAKICHFRRRKVAIVVAGGIAPGINAVIDGIVQRHRLYDKTCEVHGFLNGFFGLSHQVTPVSLYPRVGDIPRDVIGKGTAEHVSRGGSMIGTYRLDRLDVEIPGGVEHGFLRNILTALQLYDALYVIGGDGSMKMANMLATELRRVGNPISVVGIPKTMDNDILWIWQTFGFATAVEKARDVIESLSIEKSSNPRICVVQLCGSVSGFVVSHAVLACQSGVCDAALIPEAKFSVKKVADLIISRNEAEPIPQGLVVMAETAIATDWEEYQVDANLTESEIKSVMAYERATAPNFLDGQTTDELRSAGLKILQKGLERELKNHYTDTEPRVFSNEPRHILRSANPSFTDIIFGQRLGALAVDNAIAGYADFMVSQWLTEFVMVPLSLVAIGRKRIYEEGMFWKSVLAKTGQGSLEEEPSAATEAMSTAPIA